MSYRFSYHSYRRSFVYPLQTAHGVWSVREGFIVRVEDAACIGYGEIAPIPDFGTETVEQARDFLESLVVAPELAQERAVLAALPCCAFGLSSAVATLRVAQNQKTYQLAGLLPSGSSALSVLAAKLAQGYTTFKWKIGVEPLAVECALLRELCAVLPAGVRLRLDANEALSMADLEYWLRALQKYSSQVDYIEQPLPVGQETDMAEAAASFGVRIALDESLSGQNGLHWLEPGAWDGPLVLKPALLGDCDQLVERLRPLASQVVLSSVFETAIGLENALRFADQLPELNPVIGFDTSNAFNDTLGFLNPAAIVPARIRAQFDTEAIWKQLPYLN